MVGFDVRRFPISFDVWYVGLSSFLLMPPGASYVEVDREWVKVRMAWAFRSKFSRSAITSVTVAQKVGLTRGVHGFAGRWLVNGSGEGIVSITLNPRGRARVLGFPVRLRELLISVREPSNLIALLTPRV
ncbi:MAG: hypothetical protein N5P05_003472 [Chroococcopsis gigantea SAG 12.99]|jgi:hypothetical protein|nr:hypothetical protein [Chlorogloea purpurea SAG 13.99]MDV3001866.1 hypothetical protein [Chroococcopsis gigantea SAG 12.99]